MSSNYSREGDHMVETIGENVAYTLGLKMEVEDHKPGNAGSMALLTP